MKSLSAVARAAFAGAALGLGAAVAPRLGEDGGPGRNPHGLVCLANEARFTTATFSEPMTAYTVGWKDPEDLAGLMGFFAPDVPAGRRFEFKRAVNAQQFLTETDDVRAIGSAFKTVEFGGETVLGKTINKGLTVRVDHDQEPDKNFEQRYVALLMQRLLRNDLRRGMAILDAGANNTAAVWKIDGNAANPDGDVRTLLATATDKCGVRPNRVLYSGSAWDLRANSYDVQNNAGATRSSAMTPEEVARKLNLSAVRVAEARYQSTLTAKGRVVTTLKVYGLYVEPSPMRDDGTHIKRFVSPCEDGQMMRVYIERGMKWTDITVEFYSSVVATHTLGLECLTVAPTA